MGWQDDPVVGGGKPRWADDPQVGASAMPPASGLPARKTSQAIAATTGLGNGISAGVLDRMAAGMGALVPNGADTSIWEGPQGGRSLRDAYNLTLQQVQGYKGDLQRDHPKTFMGAEIAGGIASPVGRVVPGGGLARSLANDAIYGTMYGAASNKDAVEGGLEGGLSSVGTSLGMRTLGKAISPALSPAVAKLKELGVHLTPGQAIGGMAKSVEDKLTSIPLIGDLINNSRRTGVMELNRGVIDEALGPINARLPKAVGAGREAVDWAHRTIEDSYTKALSAMNVEPDDVFRTGLSDVMAGVSNLAKDQAEDLQRIIKKHVTPFVGDVMDGKQIQKIKIGLNESIDRYRKGAPRDHDIADSLEGIRDEFMGLAQRASGWAGDLYRATDSAFANLVPVSKASAKVLENAPFSPGNLATAVREADRSARKTKFARGNARMQKASDAAMAVMPSKTPDSGSPGRLILAGLTGGGAGTAAMLGHPGTLAAGSFAAFPYLPGGRQAVDWALTGRQSPLAKKIGQGVGLLARPASAAAPILLDRK